MGSLTDLEVRSAKKAEKPKKLSDGKGLHLLITPAGGKLWRAQYRHEGKQKTLALGAYPEVTVSQARAKLAAARELLDQGQDPAVQARVATRSGR